MSIGIIIGIVVVGLVVGFFLRHILGGMVGLYRIVPVNEAHIRIMNNRKDIYSTRSGKTAYWFVPFITKLHKLPLCNLSVPVQDIKLNDKNMAKFICDIACFINIEKIDLAVERLILDSDHDLGFDLGRLADDLKAIMESIGRTVATKQSILEIYMDRQTLVRSIANEVEHVFPQWGIKLVNLELKHIKDADNSTIIADIERKVAAEIRRDAEIKVATTNREAEIAKAEAEEAYRKRQIEKDKNIALAQQEQLIAVQQKKAEANIQDVEAQRKLDVGKAEIAKQIVEQTAHAQRIKVEQEASAQKMKYQTEAEGQAKQILSVGQAEADMIKAKKLAEAEGTLKMAEALAKFDDVGVNVKMIDVQKEIVIEKYRALAAAMQKAHINWVMSGDNASEFFGLNLSGVGGANLKQFLEESGLSLEKLQKLLPEAKK